MVAPPDPNTPSRPPGSEGGSAPPSWLLRCSKDRTLYVRRQPDGSLRLVKVLDTGTMADAKAEAMLGSQLELQGLLRVHDAGLDPVTGRPCVVADYHEGVDLQRYVQRQGPLPPAVVARIAAALAETLRSLHQIRRADGGIGFVHCDVKPGNIMLLGAQQDPKHAPLLLVDLEHVHATGRRGNGRRFTGGTVGYAPPEAHLGEDPTPAFDIFALGATLHLLALGRPPFDAADPSAISAMVLAGRRAKRALRRLPARLARLIEDCLALDPKARPSAGQVVTEGLACLEEAHTSAPFDAVLEPLHAGDVEHAAVLLQQAVAQVAQDCGEAERRSAALTAEIEHVRRLKGRIAAPATSELETALAAMDTETAARLLARRTPRLVAYLRRFPGDPVARRAADLFTVAGTRLLDALPTALAALRHTGHFEQAELLLCNAQVAVAALHQAFGALPIPANAVQLTPSPLHRDPERFLSLMLADLKACAAEHGAMMERMIAAESRLQITEVMAIVADATVQHGGTSEIVSTLKDREHRLRFYVDRLLLVRPRLEDLRHQVEANGVQVDLTPIEQLVQACEDIRREDRSENRGETPFMRDIGMRTALRTLLDLTREYPHVEPAVGPAVRALQTALAGLTTACWQLMEQARQSLAAQPIPIRPMQALLNRVDGCRLLEAFVDLPDRSRESLVDEIEAVRLRLDQARTTRDRIARGAQEAISRGHLTTALYEMTKAADRFSQDLEETGGVSRQLADQIEEARNRKREIDRMATRNQALAARIAELQDDPKSLSEDRVRALQERRETLEYLLRNVANERRADYVQDLRDVEVVLLKEHVDQSESAFAATSDLRQRLEIARGAVELIRRNTFEPSTSQGPIGRVQRILEHWRTLQLRTEQEIQAQEAAIRASEAGRRRARILRMAKVAVVLVLLFGVYEVSMARSRSDTWGAVAALLRAEHDTPLIVEITDSGPRYDRSAALRALDRYARRLAGAPVPSEHRPSWDEVVNAARQLVDNALVLEQPAIPSAFAQWQVEFLAARRNFDRAVGALGPTLPETRSDVAETLSMFAVQAHEVALCAAVTFAFASPHQDAAAEFLAASSIPDFRLSQDVRERLQLVLALKR